MKLAVALLVLVGVTHFGYDWIALHYADPAAAGRAWFYMARGIEGAALFGIVACLHRGRAVVAACALGMFEEGMTTACRAASPIAGAPGVALFSGLCGDTWYRIGLAALGVVALAIAYDLGAKDGQG